MSTVKFLWLLGHKQMDFSLFRVSPVAGEDGDVFLHCPGRDGQREINRDVHSFLWEMCDEAQSPSNDPEGSAILTSFILGNIEDPESTRKI